ncbi:MAG: BamA/TamA family outer membrane protein [Gammaproteobacteria bacterium]|nr:BamA/TamA family outer membrane protein [Gammaproteobacteria bacterium]
MNFKNLFAGLSLFLVLISATYGLPTLNVVIKGLKTDALENAVARVKVLENSYGPLNLDKINTLYQLIPNEIKTAIEPFGYFHTHIENSIHAKRGEEFTATYTVTKGPRLKITDIDINISGPGSNNPAIVDYLQKLPLHRGDVFRADSYEKVKTDLFAVANAEGYVKAYLEESKVLISLKNNSTKIILHFQTGPRYYFGPLTFSDNPYNQSFLDRFIDVKENEPFSSEKLIQLQQSLSTSFYFQQVLVTPDFNHISNNRIPVTVSVTPPKSQKYNLGIGYGTFTGPRLTAGVSLRRLTDTGQHFDAQLKLSSVLSGLAGKYYIPGKNPLTDQWVLGANYQRFLPENGSSTSGTLSAGYIKKTEHLQTSADLNYLVEHYKVNDTSNEQSQLLYPNLNLNYVDADDLIHPHSGKLVNFMLRGASKTLLSSTSFIQTEVKTKYLFSPFNFAHVIVKADLGYMVVNNLKDLPLSMRFFAGGLNSIRGFRDSSIGPGRYLYTGSIEYQNHIKDHWSGAIFYDAGTATNHFGTPLARSRGVGIIYESMIGPIKLYLAQAVSKRNQPRSIEFSIGPEF